VRARLRSLRHAGFLFADPINHSIVEAINEVGPIMGLKTVAEFVEDDRTRLALRKIGVDYAQGWGIHKPVLLSAQKAGGGKASALAQGGL
jgi:EAL domain-containing protein (putative c-di-GMP-specific phosphodiesterase class I)